MVRKFRLTDKSDAVPHLIFLGEIMGNAREAVSPSEGNFMKRRSSQLTPNSRLAIRALQDAGQPLTIAQLSEAIFASPASMEALVRNLVKRGFLTRIQVSGQPTLFSVGTEVSNA
jgi:hypothetical protein